MNNFALIDTHAHLTGLEETRDVDALLDRARLAGIQSIINISTHPDELKAGLELSRRYPWIYNAAALPPHDVSDPSAEAYLVAMEAIARESKLIAIGECGLDYHYPAHSKQLEQDIFRRQIALARELQLPLLIHCREAFTDLFHIFDQERAPPKVLIHCFSGSKEEAREALDRGYYLGISGIVTFKKSHALQEIVKNAPIEQLLLETDAPFLSPEGFRGKPNESAYIVEIAKYMSVILGIPFEILAHTTSENARKFFSI